MATVRQSGERAVPRVRVTGPGVHRGRIAVPDLVKICSRFRALSIGRPLSILAEQRRLVGRLDQVLRS